MKQAEQPAITSMSPNLVSPATVDFMAAMHKFLVTDVTSASASFQFLSHCFYCLRIVSVLDKLNQSINQSKKSSHNIRLRLLCNDNTSVCLLYL